MQFRNFLRPPSEGETFGSRLRSTGGGDRRPAAAHGRLGAAAVGALPLACLSQS